MIDDNKDKEEKEEKEESKFNLKDDTYLSAKYSKNGNSELEKIAGVAMNLKNERTENPQIFEYFWSMELRIDFCHAKLKHVVNGLIENNNNNIINKNVFNKEFIDILKITPDIIWKCVATFIPSDLPSVQCK